MECVTRVFYNDLPPNSHPFHMCVCVCASLHLWAFMQVMNFALSELYSVLFHSNLYMKLCVCGVHSSAQFISVSYTLCLIGTDIYVRTTCPT